MANKPERGLIWEAVPGEYQHYYLILSVDEVVRLRRLCDGKVVERFLGQVTALGIVRNPKNGEKK